MEGSIEEMVIEIVAHQLGVSMHEVVPSASFIKDLGTDSLDIVELIMALEDGFGLDIPDKEAEGITTVGEAIEYIKKATTL